MYRSVSGFPRNGRLFFHVRAFKLTRVKPVSLLNITGWDLALCRSDLYLSCSHGLWNLSMRNRINLILLLATAAPSQCTFITQSSNVNQWIFETWQTTFLPKKKGAVNIPEYKSSISLAIFFALATLTEWRSIKIIAKLTRCILTDDSSCSN